jgi:hypothetical protein
MQHKKTFCGPYNLKPQMYTFFYIVKNKTAFFRITHDKG